MAAAIHSSINTGTFDLSNNDGKTGASVRTQSELKKNHARLLIGGAIAAIALVAIGFGVWCYFPFPSAGEAASERAQSLVGRDASLQQVRVQELALEPQAQLVQSAQTFRDCPDCPEMVRIPG